MLCQGDRRSEARQIVLTFILALVLCFFLSMPEAAAGVGSARKGDERRAIILIADGIAPTDFFDPGLPNIASLARRGAVGLMNTTVSGQWHVSSGYVTLGAGSRARGSDLAGLAFEATERYRGQPAAEVFSRNTGREPGPDLIFHLGATALDRENAGEDHPVSPGLLGLALQEAGKKAAVLGNADDYDQYRRYAVTVAMEPSGRVAGGLVGRETLLADPRAPSGVRTDWEVIRRGFSALDPEISLVVIEAGDTSRIELNRPFMLDTAAETQVGLALRRLDEFLGWLVAGLDPERDLLVVLSPNPPERARAMGEVLTPVFAVGPEFRPGLLTSGTTRRPGLVANIDIAPTVLEHLGLAVPQAMAGRAVASVAAAEPLGALRSLARWSAAVIAWRMPLIKTYVILEIALVVAAVGVLLLRLPVLAYFRPLVLSLTVVPLAFLLLPLTPAAGVLQSFLWLAGIAALLTIAALRLGKRHGLDPFIIICFGTTATIVGDVLSGGFLLGNSPLGYSVAAGARFYGIGNEYMGILIGATLVGSTAILDRWCRGRRGVMVGVGVLYVLVIAILAAPQMGANFGGAVAATIGLGYTYFRLWRQRWGWLEMATLGAMVAGVAGLILVLDAIMSGAGRETHVLRAARELATGGLPALGEIASRKAAMNVKLIRYTFWSRVFLTTLGSFALLVHRPLGLFSRVVRQYPDLGTGFSGVLVASVVALVANDSGVVAAATTMVYATATLLYLLVRETSDFA